MISRSHEAGDINPEALEGDRSSETHVSAVVFVSDHEILVFHLSGSCPRSYPSFIPSIVRYSTVHYTSSYHFGSKEFNPDSTPKVFSPCLEIFCRCEMSMPVEGTYMRRRTNASLLTTLTDLRCCYCTSFAKAAERCAGTTVLPCLNDHFLLLVHKYARV